VPVALLIVFLLAFAPRAHARAQSVEGSAGLVQAAVARLTGAGYIAQFRASGDGLTVSGEARYGTPVAYGLLIQQEQGAGYEYLLLDPDLYFRGFDSETASWTPWQRRNWHADAPLEAVLAYHPRLPLELMRFADDLRDEGEEQTDSGSQRRISGMARYYAALSASYEDVLVPNERGRRLGQTRWPLTLWLDVASGDIRRLELTIGDGPELGTEPAGDAPRPRVASRLTYTFESMAVATVLTPPANARDVPGVAFQEAPEGEPQALPITSQGATATITTPVFTAESGTFAVVLRPAVSNLQYRVWRVKRGRLLSAAIGSLLVINPTVRIPFELPPGQYLVELVYPEAVDWEVTIIELPTGTPSDR